MGRDDLHRTYLSPIVLTGESARQFNYLARHPSKETMQKRDAYLKHIKDTLDTSYDVDTVILKRK